MTHPPDLAELLGDIDIYLLDQVLRGRIRPPMKVFDAGCGTGRNLVWLLRSGCEVAAVDADPAAVAQARDLTRRLAPRVPEASFQVAPIEQAPLPDGWADVVLAVAVLHFARDEAHFRAMLNGAWRVVRPGGLFFSRLASTIGCETTVRPLGGRRFSLPDGTERFLVDAALLESLTTELGGTLADPLKTTVVHRQRSMTTWVVRRAGR